MFHFASLCKSATPQKSAQKVGVSSQFIVMDAEKISFEDSFDVLWSIESISHYQDKKKFFNRSIKFLSPGGKVALIDWFKKENITEEENKKYITPIEKGMLVQLHSMNDYISILESEKIKIIKLENISQNTAKTWDLSLEIIKNKMLWQLAIKSSKDFLNFLKSFKAMKNGFSSGNFVYGLIIAQK